MSILQGNELFKDLFVLELANNHWGKVERGLKIIQDHGSVVRHNGVKAAIKLQFRDVDSFIHPDYKEAKANRYIAKTEATRMSREDYAVLVKAIRKVSCIPMATPFDEQSVDLCVAYMPIIKIASSDLNDWPLIEKIASTRLPVIVSTEARAKKTLMTWCCTLKSATSLWPSTIASPCIPASRISWNSTRLTTS